MGAGNAWELAVNSCGAHAIERVVLMPSRSFGTTPLQPLDSSTVDQAFAQGLNIIVKNTIQAVRGQYVVLSVRIPCFSDYLIAFVFCLDRFLTFSCYGIGCIVSY